MMRVVVTMSRLRRENRRRRNRGPSSVRAFWVVSALIVFLAADVALVVFAFNGTQLTAPNTSKGVSELSPQSVSPTNVGKTLGTMTPSASATPATPSAASPASFLKVLSATSGWRASAGNCGFTTPVIESTVDGGITWVAHDPGTLDARQVLGLSAVSDDDATVVAATGRDCTLEDLGTTSAGAYWDSYPTRLANENFVDTTTPGTLQIGGATVTAPCQAPLQVQIASGQPWVLCPGELFSQSAVTGKWGSLSTPGAGSFTITTSGALVARRGVTGCAGITVSSLDAPLATAELTNVSCATSQPASGSIAIDAAGNSVWLVANGRTTVSANGGTSW
jgi:hypothetical protein